MAGTESKVCDGCQGSMHEIIVMDKSHSGMTRHMHTGPLEYRLPDDRVSFWTGKFPSAGLVKAFLCEDCGRIALYGAAIGA